MKLAAIALGFSLSSFACEILVPHHMVIMGADATGRSIYQTKNCDDKLVEDFHQVVLNLEGKVASYHLKEAMNAKGYSLQVDPNLIEIKHLKSLIREQLILPPGVQVKSTRSQNHAGILSLAPGDQIEVSCVACLYGNQQPINLTINGFDGSRRSLIATVDFKKMVKAYKLIAPLPSFSDVSVSSHLKEEYVEAVPHTDLLTDLESLKFYKTNKPLKTGEILRQSDLNALNIVKAGLKTDVIMENQMIRIKTYGISRSNGTIGEYVEVFHPQKNKKYQGKVIDINKVLVEL